LVNPSKAPGGRSQKRKRPPSRAALVFEDRNGLDPHKGPFHKQL
jgi:hypothetical protein